MKNLLIIALSFMIVTAGLVSCSRDNSDELTKNEAEWPYYINGHYYAPKNYYKKGGYWGNDGYYYRSELYYYYDNDIPYYFQDNDVSKIKIYVEKQWGDAMNGIDEKGLQEYHHNPTVYSNSFILPEQN